MELKLTHAVVLTQFESTLTPLDFDTISAQDYVVHVIYNQVTNSLVFLSSPQKFDGLEQSIKIRELMDNLLIPVHWDKTILIMGENENEYDAQSILRHLSH